MREIEANEELLRYLAKCLVDDPEAVQVQGEDEDGTLVFELSVADDDLGKIIGKDGRTARAIRTLLVASAAKTRRRALLQILE
ncbi:MAG: KH domain-containing protein [Polyangiales bacterium]